MNSMENDNSKKYYRPKRQRRNNNNNNDKNHQLEQIMMNMATQADISNMYVVQDNLVRKMDLILKELDLINKRFDLLEKEKNFEMKKNKNKSKTTAESDHDDLKKKVISAISQMPTRPTAPTAPTAPSTPSFPKRNLSHSKKNNNRLIDENSTKVEWYPVDNLVNSSAGLFGMLSSLIGGPIKKPVNNDIDDSDSETFEDEPVFDNEEVEEITSNLETVNDLINLADKFIEEEKIEESEKKLEQSKKESEEENINQSPKDKIKQTSLPKPDFTPRKDDNDLSPLEKMLLGDAGDFIITFGDAPIIRSEGVIFPENFSKPQTTKIKNVKSTGKLLSNGLYEYKGKKYPINLETVKKLRKPLNKLNKLIGLSSVKDSILDMILYYLQNFETKNNNMLHTVIEGPPGVGKTELGRILAEIYAALGIIPSKKFKCVRRTDLIGEYLGHTAQKTQRAIDEADGGVLFIDEAYSLGNEDKRDSFSKECIDTLNQNLSEKKKKLIVIIAGYQDELEKSFFSYNPGLRRRFPFKFTIEGYSSDELRDIFLKKLKDSRWKVNEQEIDISFLTKFFDTNKDKFLHYGGDIENLIVSCKFMHSRRLVGKHPKYRKIITKADIEQGLNRFIKNKKSKNQLSSEFIQSMYT